MKILIVDDDVELTTMIAEILRADGHDVSTAADGSAALRLVHASAPEAVLLDLQLPDVHGFDIAHAFRTGLLPADASIIVITGTRTAKLEQADEAGVDLLLDKPVESEHLSGLVEYVTRRRHELLRAPGPIRCLHW